MSIDPEQLRQKLQGYPSQVVDSFLLSVREGDTGAFEAGLLGALGFLSAASDADSLRMAPDDARLREDLNIDSLAMVELVFLLEDTFGISIQDAEIHDVQTIGDFKRLAAEKLSAGTV